MNSEMQAWQWLLNLPRLNYVVNAWHEMNQQVIVRMCPGVLYAGSGEPFVKVSLHHPLAKKRIIGSGNSLYAAVDEAHRELWRTGIKTPFISV